MITVTVDVRTLDATSGPIPTFASVLFARLAPSTTGGVLVTTDTVEVTLNSSGHGTIQLRENTPYEVHCYGLNGFEFPFAIRTGATATTLADLWQSGQIDPGGQALPPMFPSLADEIAAIVAGYTAARGPWTAGVAYPKNSLVIQAGAVYLAPNPVPARTVFTPSDWQALGGGTSGPVTVIDNGDGTFTTVGATVIDNGDGTFNLAA